MSERAIKNISGFVKFTVALVIMVVSMALFLANINEAMSAELVRDVTITGEAITLGDIFNNVENNADFVLAPAPRPNETLIWDAKTLRRIVQSFDLNKRLSATDQVKIRRLATFISREDLENAIATALADEGVSGPVALDFVGGEPEIILPYNETAILKVKEASYNASRETFSAHVSVGEASSHHFTGIVHGLVDIPVLKTPVMRGDIISKNMITTMQVREDSLTDATLLSAEDLAGMTPRRVLRANTPIIMSELNRPVMVKRGDLVTMELNSGPIRVTAIAKAMENGTKGDIIRLVNMDSNRTLEAEVTGQRAAKVYF
jgi:flagella basal body P-ring formation protein FlgA